MSLPRRKPGTRLHRARVSAGFGGATILAAVERMAKKLTNFRIDADLLDGMESIRDRDGISVSEQVRRAIQMWLDARERRARAARRKGVKRR